MVGAGCNVFAVWNYVIAKTQRSVIELNPKLLCAILGGSESEITSAIEYLCRPDPESRSKIEDGRRMVKDGQFQYRVVNWAEYQTIRDANDLKEYNRRKQAEYRAKKRGKKATRAAWDAEQAAYVKALENGGQPAADKVMDDIQRMEGQ